MRTLNKDNVQKVVDTVFAHTQVRLRNILITLLLDNLWNQEPRMTKDIKSTLLGTVSNSIGFAKIILSTGSVNSKCFILIKNL